MNEEINALLRVYQQKVSQLTAMNISLEAKLQVLNAQIEALSSPQEDFQSASIPNNKKDLINFKLELAGIACSSGSACQSGSSEPSHVLSQILSQEEIKKISIRFSFSKFNSKNEIIYAADSIKKILSEF